MSNISAPQEFKPFLHIDPQNEAKRPIEERLKDYKQVYQEPQWSQVTRQATRCMNCGVPFCHGDHGCPVDNLIPEWNELVARGKHKEALDRLHLTNNFPEFTGQLCPAPCEAGCVLAIGEKPVTIRQIELAIINEGFRQGWVKPQTVSRNFDQYSQSAGHYALHSRSSRSSGKSVAIVGSGPAGLAAAQELARMGHHVIVYEKASLPGGLLRYGIPDFKLEKWVIDRRLNQLQDEGVVFRCNVNVGADIAWSELIEVHDAVGIAVGAEAPRDLMIPGRELTGICYAMDYLIAQNQIIQDPQKNLGALDARGKKVVIIGGGDTGSDCLGTTLRQEASSVLQFELMPAPPLERSSTTPWPMWPLKLRKSHAHEEGGERYFGIATTAFHGQNGQVSSLKTIKVEMAHGKVQQVPGSESEIAADMVILAIGFQGVEAKISKHLPQLKLSSFNTLWTDPNYMTSIRGIFAAGDARRGASLIVWAIAEGRKMAQGIDRFLLG
jgi:glutamate synthase (NADPH/NADH) small chain